LSSDFCCAVNPSVADRSGFGFDLPAPDAASCDSPNLSATPTRVGAVGFLIKSGQYRRKFGDPSDEVGRRCELNDQLTAPNVNEGREHFQNLRYIHFLHSVDGRCRKDGRKLRAVLMDGAEKEPTQPSRWIFFPHNSRRIGHIPQNSRTSAANPFL